MRTAADRFAPSWNVAHWALLWLGLTALFTAASALGSWEAPLAYDWRAFFAGGARVPDYYPPWTAYLCRLLTLPLLSGLTLSTYVVAVLQKARSRIGAVCAFLVLPLLWTLFLGQIDGLALLGVVGLPWLVPLVLTKPQVAFFAVLARRDTLLIAVFLVVVSLAVWGMWPLDVLACHAGDPAGTWPQNIGLGLWGLPLFALLVWRMPRDDPDWWMLAGVTLTPQLIPYNLLPVMPAVARLRWPWALAVALTSWLPLAANWWGAWAWRLGWVSVLLLVVGLALSEGALLGSARTAAAGKDGPCH